MTTTPLEPEPTTPELQTAEPELPGSSTATVAAGEQNVEPPAAEQAEELEAASGNEPQTLDPLKEQLLRLAADFDNYRKRSRKELAEARQLGMDMVFVNLLPVLDNLQLALIHSQDASPALKQGLLLVEKQFIELLQQAGIHTIAAESGDTFDPKVHEAIGQTSSTTIANGCIVQEVQRGYRQGDKLLRPSKVMVASEPTIST